VVEIDVVAESLDERDMVVDFSDIKRAVKEWIDRELDHKMILRQDDPLVEVLRAQGEPIYTIDSNPTAERLARLIFDKAAALGFNVSAVRLWETPGSCASWSPSKK
jgi:6-pyruvoyltetrahydropterin/6-carboxytetrahydropterin synthase